MKASGASDRPELPPSANAHSLIDGLGEVTGSPVEAAADRLLVAEEVAAMLQVPTRWVRDHTRSGLLPHLRLGRYIRYRREALLAWLAEQERGGAAWRKHRPKGADLA